MSNLNGHISVCAYLCFREGSKRLVYLKRQRQEKDSKIERYTCLLIALCNAVKAWY